MFREVVLTILLLLALTTYVDTACCQCLNTIWINSEGVFHANTSFTIESKPPNGTLNYQLNGLFIKNKYLNISVRYNIVNNSQSYLVQNTSIKTVGETFQGVYHQVSIEDTTIFTMNTSYVVERINESLVYRSILVKVETNSNQKMLHWNLTLASFLLKYNQLNTRLSYTTVGDKYVAEITLSNLSTTIYDNDTFLKTLLGIPIDNSLISIFNNLMKQVLFKTMITNNTVELYRYYEYHGQDLFKSNDSYLLLINPYSVDNAYAIIGYDYLITVTNTSWHVYGDDKLHVYVELYGVGFGENRDARITNVLNNFRELSKRYGCFRLNTIGFYITYYGEQYSSFTLNETTDLNRIGIATNEEEGSSINYMIYIIGFVSTALIILILFFVNIRRRRSSVK